MSEILTQDFNDEMSQDFIDYCYQTNIERAFAAIDGLKPGQRACIWEMYRKKYFPNKPHVKSAKVSGAVTGDLWPHGDAAIYETFARMAQGFVNNSPVCEFHGSEGNQIIPEPSSARYTEVRLSKIGMELFSGIEKKNVPFIMNFDETEEWPEVLPTPIPTLLINGSEGIGTTIAQKWLPYDFTEATTAYKNFLATGEMDYTLAPSFPSGGIIINKNELDTILKTGKGKVTLRAKSKVEGNVIHFTEICYQTCVRDLMEEFKKLFDADDLPGVEDIQNMSGKNGIDIKVVCSNSASPKTVLEMLYKKTNLQKSYSANQNIIINKVPKLINTENYFQLLYEHNDECLVREINFDKRKAEDRLHILEGLLKALEDIDNIILIIKKSESAALAKTALINKYGFSEIQAKAILDMRLSKLANLEKVEIQNEFNDLTKKLAELIALLNDSNSRKQKIIANLDALLSKYKSTRKSELKQISISKDDKDIINVEPEKCVVVMNKDGTIKRIPSTSFRTQKRNGKGVKTLGDIVKTTIRTNTIDSLMIFTNKGKMYRILVDEVPVGTNTSKGVPIASLVAMDPGETPELIYSIYRDTDAQYLLFTTKNGTIKKTPLDEYIKTKKKTGMIAINLREGDSIASVNLIKDENLILLTNKGMGIKIKSTDCPISSRVAIGVKGITLNKDDYVITTLPIRNNNDNIAIFCGNGLGKKISIDSLTTQNRGGKGLIVSKEESGIVSGALVEDSDNLLIVGSTNSICISASEIPLLSRTSLGNIMIKCNIKAVSKI